MADDGDEDVVFQNSALHNHLQNVGYQNHDIDPEHRHSQDALPRSNQQECQSLTMAFFRHLYASVLTWLGIGDEWHQRRMEMDRVWGDNVCKVVLGRDALEPEDAEFVENVAHVQQQEETMEPPVRSSRYGLERLLSVGVGISAYTTARLFYPRVTVMTMTYDWIVGLFGVLLLLPPSIRLLHTWAYHRRQKRVYAAFITTIAAAEKWRKVTRRSIRLVQEMELVARGFTLVSRVSPAERLEAGSLLEARRQCPDLRRLILLTSRELMLHMRNATNDLIKAWPLGAETETMYLCQVSLEEYGPIITNTDEESIASCTDNYGLTHIKAVLEICNLQLSEYLKRFVLMCLIPPPEDAKADSGVFEDTLPLSESGLSLATSAIQNSYKVHHCELLTDRASRSELKETPEEKANRQRSVLNHTYTAVHSLDLHLQTALRRARTMGDELEALCSKTQKEARQDAELNKRLETDLTKIKADLASCMECWEEAIRHVGKAYKPAPSPSDSPTHSKKESSILGDNREKEDPIPLFEMGDPVIPDQVFEAYTEENAKETTEWGVDEFLTPEEREKKKQEKKEALRLLRELKTVIAVRAADWDEREERARQRMGDSTGKPKNTDSDVDGPNITAVVVEPKPTTETDIGDIDTLSVQQNACSGGSKQQRSSRSSEESADTDQRELVRQDCMHTCGEDSEDNITEELVDDLHEDLVNLGQPAQSGTAVFESQSDGEEDIFGDTGQFSEDDEEGDLDRIDPDNVGDEAATQVRLSALKEKLAREPGAGLGFSASTIASLAAQRSKVFGQTESQTFGDGDSSGDEGVIES